jgi:hypothetical protein
VTPRRYLLGVALVAMAGAGLVLAVPGTMRTEVIWGVATGLILQAPLGWWALRSIGRDEFMLVWTLGMLVRLTVVGIAGLALIPVLGLRAGPMLGSMVGVLVALLLVEGVTAAREHS